MDVRFVRNGQILIAEVDGRINGTSASDLESAVTSAIPDADQGMICDLSCVPYVSSAGLRSNPMCPHNRTTVCFDGILAKHHTHQ